MTDVDPRIVLNQALERAGISAASLAARGGTSEAAVSRYLSGRQLPTVTTLNRLLAGVGLQLRVSLEPVPADVDERVDAMLAGTPSVDVASITSTAASFAEDRGFGPVPWAVDGAAALNLHGLAVECPLPVVAVELGEALRRWLFKGLMRATTPADDLGSWVSWDLEQLQESTRGPVVGRFGFLFLRIVEQLPATLMVQPAGSDVALPVVTVDEVERTRPELAEVLARWRERRALMQ
jgi:transcriptional regulator with XRE-family HTH domain